MKRYPITRTYDFIIPVDIFKIKKTEVLNQRILLFMTPIILEIRKKIPKIRLRKLVKIGYQIKDY